MTRRHTARMVAAALAVGLLAAALTTAAPAQAQRAAGPTPAQLTAHVTGARVTLRGHPLAGAGTILYTYDVAYPTQPDLYGAYLIDITPTRASALAANGAFFQIGRRPDDGGHVVSTHRNGAWFAGEAGRTTCRMATGTASGRVAFAVAIFGPAGQCARLTPRLLALERSLVVPLAIAQL